MNTLKCSFKIFPNFYIFYFKKACRLMFYFSRRRYIYIHECMQLFFAGFDKYSGIRIIALLTGQSILENSRHIPQYQINFPRIKCHVQEIPPCHCLGVGTCAQLQREYDLVKLKAQHLIEKSCSSFVSGNTRIRQSRRRLLRIPGLFFSHPDICRAEKRMVI